MRKMSKQTAVVFSLTEHLTRKKKGFVMSTHRAYEYRYGYLTAYYRGQEYYVWLRRLH